MKGEKLDIWIQFSDGEDHAHRFHWAFMVIPTGQTTGVKYHIKSKGFLGLVLIDELDQTLNHGLGRVKIGTIRGEDRKNTADADMFKADYRDILRDPVICRTWMIRVMHLLEDHKILQKGTATYWEGFKGQPNDQIKVALTGKGWVS